MGQQGRGNHDRTSRRPSKIAPLLIEDYALIGDRGTAALVGRDGSIDWLCLPRFDSDAVFTALLGDETNGCWKLAPRGSVTSSTRRYSGHTMVLETTYVTASGRVRVTDFMHAFRNPGPHIMRIVDGLEGSVELEMALTARFGYGDLPPWTRLIGDAWTMTAVGDALALRCDVEIALDEHDPRATFTVGAGEQRTFDLAWYPSHEDPPVALDARAALERTLAWWNEWSAQITITTDYPEDVFRSLLMLEALTYAPSGAGVAAVTTSLPEVIGGAKNWDYRYAWVRDSTYTIGALLHGGLTAEARAWRDWVLCALAGRPENMQIMYGIDGQRRIDEYELPALKGYEGSQPVRIGNAAYTQFQLGIYGETMSAFYVAHQRGVEIDASAWQMISILVEHVVAVWNTPDSGIWESRAEPRHYVHSKVLAWRAMNVAVRAIDEFGFDGPRDRWKAVADQIHADVCAKGFNAELNSFVQSYGSDAIDAAVLMIPMVTFLPADDPRMLGTIAQLEKRLLRDGFLYRTSLDPETAARHAEPEGAFLACNFWLVENYALSGRIDGATALFERLLAIGNDLGIFAEEYDPALKRQVGNVPQTLTHASLVNAANRLAAVTRAHPSRVAP
jgi:GH15 family glucan-1,4-alpha-glucosidase